MDAVVHLCVKTKFITKYKKQHNLKSFRQNKHNVHLYLFQRSYLLSKEIPLAQTSDNVFCLAAIFDCLHGNGR